MELWAVESSIFIQLISHGTNYILDALEGHLEKSQMVVP